MLNVTTSTWFDSIYKSRLYLICRQVPMERLSAPTVFSCGHRPSTFIAQLFWPRQETPTSYQTRLWTKYVATSFLPYRYFWTTPLGPRVPLQPDYSSNPLVIPLSPNNYPSLPSFLKAIPLFYRRLLHHHVQIATDKEVWGAFQSKNRLEIVTDGSLALDVDTFGWRLLRPPNLIPFEGTGPVDGPFELSTSTRSELGGYAAPLLLVAAVSRFWGDSPIDANFGGSSILALPPFPRFRWSPDPAPVHEVNLTILTFSPRQSPI